MNIEEAIDRVKRIIKITYTKEFATFELMYQDVDAIETLLTAYEEKEKIIDEMAGYLAIIRDCPNENCGANLDCENRCNNDDDLIEECWKMYFERKIKYE